MNFYTYYKGDSKTLPYPPVMRKSIAAIHVRAVDKRGYHFDVMHMFNEDMSPDTAIYNVCEGFADWINFLIPRREVRVTRNGEESILSKDAIDYFDFILDCRSRLNWQNTSCSVKTAELAANPTFYKEKVLALREAFGEEVEPEVYYVENGKWMPDNAWDDFRKEID